MLEYIEKKEDTMLIKDSFEEVFTGFNMSNSVSNEKHINEEFFIQKDSIQYTNIIEKKLVKKAVTTDIKNKYFMKDRDIIISLKKPYKVGTYRFNDYKPIVIPNNFVILRGINRDLYSFIFVANYLEKIGIDKYIRENGLANRDLTATDINYINLPDISKEEQMKISNLMNLINDRSAIYSTILENDDEIIKYALTEIVGENNV